MNGLLSLASSVLQHRLEPWRMRMRLAKVSEPRPSKKALVTCWREVRHAAQRAPRLPVAVPLAPYTLHGHNAADLLDVFYDVFIAEGYSAQNLGERPFIVDCGANVGVASLYFKLHYPESRLLAFEPNPACVPLWHRNVTANGIKGAELVEAAVGATSGTHDFYFADDRTLGSSLSHHSGEMTATRSVRVARLSDAIDAPVDLLKLDIEGAEQDVLEELVGSGAIASVRRIAVEYHHRMSSPESTLSRFLVLLENAGFTYKIVAGMRGHHFDERWQSLMVYAIRQAS